MAARVALFVLAACGGASVKQTPTLVDPDPKCPSLDQDCLVGLSPIDEQCGTNLIVKLGRGTKTIDPYFSPVLDGVAIDAPKLADGVLIFVGAESYRDDGLERQRRETVMAALEARGVPRNRLAPGRPPHLDGGHVPEGRVQIRCGITEPE